MHVYCIYDHAKGLGAINVEKFTNMSKEQTHSLNSYHMSIIDHKVALLYIHCFYGMFYGKLFTIWTENAVVIWYPGVTHVSILLRKQM